jgi:putative phosphoesterase
MLIAVIADTHNHLPSNVRSFLTEADEIWHLGDICSKETIKEIAALGVPLHAVRGNCDPRGLAPESLMLQRGEHLFYLVHEPPMAVPVGTNFVLHGHTHVPRNEIIDGVRHLNPGTVSKPNHGAPPSFAWLEIRDKWEPRWEIVQID